jgi:hypothetical protein
MKITYMEKFKKPYISIRESLLPNTLPYLTEGTVIRKMEIMALGKADIGNEEWEFQDIRVFTIAK